MKTITNWLLATACLGCALPAAAAEAIPPTITYAQVRLGEITRFASLPGSLRAEQSVTLVPKVSGYVSRIAVDRGDSVKAGQALVEIEVPELLADLQKQEAEAQVAELSRNRLQKAASGAADLVLPQALDEAEGRLASARASLARTRTLLGFASVTAPFSGSITRRRVDPGAYVAAGTTEMLTLVNTSSLRAVVPMPEAEAMLVRTGQPVRLLPDGLPGKILEAAVTRVAGSLDEATRTMVVEADVANPDGLLLPGMYVMAKVGVEKHTAALLAPVAALVMEKTNAFVFRLDGGVARKTPIKPGFNDGVSFEILEGVSAGTPLLLVGKTPLVDGQPVTATEAK